MERLNPVMMTALPAGLALIPLAIAGGDHGNEIQSPMAIVVLGGLLTAIREGQEGRGEGAGGREARQ
ncbi:MAG: hypothetical protein GEU90_18290 [Gemmatimonas sp.]|nr:hypothetical protein [Gemmatimonas sp.]